MSVCMWREKTNPTNNRTSALVVDVEVARRIAQQARTKGNRLAVTCKPFRRKIWSESTMTETKQKLIKKRINNLYLIIFSREYLQSASKSIRRGGIAQSQLRKRNRIFQQEKKR